MKRLVVGAVLVLAAFAIWALLPYGLPTSVALGPCGYDWTSPTSYARRVSPTESLRFDVGGVAAKLCYGSPGVRGRDIFGGLVPFGELWRTGANEPTRLFTDGPMSIAGVTVPAGRYSLYTMPGVGEWQLFVSRSTFHWGSDINPGVRQAEMGSAPVISRRLEPRVESLRFVWEASGETGGVLALEWDDTRVEVPFEALR